ncbi:hypothetical protein CRE_10763, partial [Caenorhabditis remanei]
MRHEEPSYGLFSFFTSSKKSISDRPRSALAMVHESITGSVAKFVEKRIRRQRRYSDLLRRQFSELSYFLLFHLLLDRRVQTQELQMTVLLLVYLITLWLVYLKLKNNTLCLSFSRSNRNTSPMTSRRCSSALQMLPEVDNISEAEKEHIQNILEKAESRTPFMIKIPMKKQISSRTESTNSRVSSEGIDEEVEIEDQRKKAIEEPIMEVPSRAVTPRNNLRVIPPPIAISHPTPPHSAKTDTGSRHSSGSSAHSQFGFNTPSISGFKIFFDKAKTATETLVKEIKDEVYLPEQDKEKIETTKVETEPSGELTSEELEHIRKVNEMAQFDEPNQPVAPVQERRKSSVVSGIKNIFGVGKPEEPELTEHEKDHIRRMSLLADKLNEEFEVVDEQLKPKTPKGFGLKSFFGKATQSVMQATDTVMKNVQQHQQKQSLGGLTQEELDQIANAAESAQQEAIKEVTQEELDHIARIAAMAAEDFKYPKQSMEPVLSKAEKDHIARIAAMAAEDFEEPLRTPQPKIILPSPIALEKAELTQEEQDHIAMIAAMAAEDSTSPYPLDRTQMIPHSREPEITEEEREHIARIAAMAAEDFKSSIPVEQSVQVSSEPVLTEEEQRHIERVAAMAADDFHASTFFSSKPPQLSEPELTAEERSHIE